MAHDATLVRAVIASSQELDSLYLRNEKGLWLLPGGPLAHAGNPSDALLRNLHDQFQLPKKPYLIESVPGSNGPYVGLEYSTLADKKILQQIYVVRLLARDSVGNRVFPDVDGLRKGTVADLTFPDERGAVRDVLKLYHNREKLFENLSSDS